MSFAKLLSANTSQQRNPIQINQICRSLARSLFARTKRERKLNSSSKQSSLRCELGAARSNQSKSLTSRPLDSITSTWPLQWSAIKLVHSNESQRRTEATGKRFNCPLDRSCEPNTIDLLAQSQRASERNWLRASAFELHRCEVGFIFRPQTVRNVRSSSEKDKVANCLGVACQIEGSDKISFVSHDFAVCVCGRRKWLIFVAIDCVRRANSHWLRVGALSQ